MSVNKKKKYKVGLTFGAYSPLHYGHINLFFEAKLQCDILIVCVSSDDYIKKHKKYDTKLSIRQRQFHVHSIKYVDKVGIQSLDFGKKEAIEKYKPDVLFVGNDWNKDTYSGMDLGVPVEFLEHTKGISSTYLRKYLKI